MNKLVVVGLDGAGHSLIKRLIRKKKLPFIARQHIEEMDSVILPDSACAWSTAYTGVNPGKHGVYGFDKRVPDKWKWYVPTAKDRVYKDYWQTASEQGKKVLVCSMPLTWPVREVNGVMVSCHFSPSKDKAVFPESVFDVLFDVMEYKLSFTPKKKLPRLIINEFKQAIDKRFNDVFDLATADKYDLICVGFEHMEKYWHLLALKHRTWPLEEIYQHFDKALKKFMAHFPEHELLMHSDHDHVFYEQELHLGKWLVENGNYLRFKRNPYVRDIKNIISSPGSETWKSININYEESSVFPCYEGHGNYGAFYVNKKKLDKYTAPELVGTYGAVRDVLKHRLEKYDYIDTVWLKEDVWSGPFLEEMPDVVIKLNDNIMVNGSDRGYLKNALRSCRSTQHGFTGVAVSSFRLEENLSLYDVRGIVLKALGCKFIPPSKYKEKTDVTQLEQVNALKKVKGMGYL